MFPCSDQMEWARRASSSPYPRDQADGSGRRTLGTQPKHLQRQSWSRGTFAASNHRSWSLSIGYVLQSLWSRQHGGCLSIAYSTLWSYWWYWHRCTCRSCFKDIHSNGRKLSCLAKFQLDQGHSSPILSPSSSKRSHSPDYSCLKIRPTCYSTPL